VGGQFAHGLPLDDICEVQALGERDVVVSGCGPEGHLVFQAAYRPAEDARLEQRVDADVAEWHPVGLARPEQDGSKAAKVWLVIASAESDHRIPSFLFGIAGIGTRMRTPQICRVRGPGYACRPRSTKPRNFFTFSSPAYSEIRL
jgi:hypothetical protein